MNERQSALAVVTQVIALVAFYLYFAGWTYSNELRSQFGLLATSIDTPAYYFIVYAYGVFFHSFWGWVLLLAVGAGWYAVARLRFIPVAEMIIIVALAILPFPMISALAASHARAEYAFLRSGGAKQVQLLIRSSPAPPYPEELLTASQQGELWLLMQTSDRAYVFTKVPADPTSHQLPEAKLFVLKSNDVDLVVTLQSIKEYGH